MRTGKSLGRSLHTPLTDEEKRDRPKVTKAFLKRVFSYLLPYWPRLALVFFAIIVSSILGLLPPLLSGRIIDDGLIGKDFNLLTQLILLSFIVLIAANLINVFESYLTTWVAQHIIYDMKNQMYEHLQKMSHRFYTNNNQGDIITRMTTDINGIQNVIVGTLTQIVSNSIILITTLVALFQKNWILALVSVIIVPLFIYPTHQVGNRRWSITMAKQEHSDTSNQLFNETLSVSGQLLVKLFTRENKEFKKFEKINQAITRLSIREFLVGKSFRVIFDTFINMGPMIIYLTGGFLMIKMGSGLTVGDVTVVVALLGRLYRPVGVLQTIQVDVIRSLALFSRIFEYFDIPVEIQNSPNAIIPKSCAGKIIFDHVSFHYDGKPILKDVNLTIEKGKSVAIVGPSGTGKSTLVNLIPRLYDVRAGRVLLDGLDIRDLDLTFLRQNIGMVSQDTYLFNGTIRENLLYADELAKEEDLIRVCQEANIYDFIQTLPEGFDTLVGNRGLKLSGGEKQRLSIARVLLKNPKILIMDEATSSLDSISESYIQEAIEPILKGRTSVIIAHRLSTIMAVDEIIVLQDGEIVQQGTHGDLVVQEGIYKELYDTQFKAALEDIKNDLGR
ncbi:ABC-type multidrug transport system, ATPase and permease component [Desulfitobacterium dichloroeliminans LMG P-21439]|uniref:ABC-type multidrug transport system, ATPase and permease component n=1 Tax=Desulfitobacterium dichloroeliminans (strain LMG P-21439 / DCA1) TaxID=871963 RepID=L0F7S0_DESDL|nr:ABC transporter ATP-binding protein [Desulfitobacterium dichloroeliminans]AGA69055.1 ABC-type multidrug transport system, ATPase and permease component [Desulfitobacterium dichloroeliminans LMG P-21439]